MSWLVILAIGLATYALRASFLLSGERRARPGWGRVVRFLPVAVLPALAASVVLGAGSGEVGIRTAAAAVGAAIAWRTRSVPAAMGAGMVTLWLLDAWTRA